MRKNFCFNSNRRVFNLNCFLRIKINLYSESINIFFLKGWDSSCCFASLYPWAGDLIYLRGDGQESPSCGNVTEVGARGSHFTIIRKENIPRKRHSKGKSVEPVWLNEWATGRVARARSGTGRDRLHRALGTGWGAGGFFSVYQGSAWQGFKHGSDMI